MTPSSASPERPIQTRGDDKLERSRFIERLASALVNSKTNKSTGVVVGITGPWGSGKSSILNLLREHLTQRYADAVVVRFDPWLVSGRNDLIAEFLGELIGTIKADVRLVGKFKKLGSTLAQYGAQLAPVGNLWHPGVGTIFSSGFRAMETALSKKESLSALRTRLVRELAELSSPIVILIDELDRVEDEEVRTVAQLVRSVADFPGISYVLAYDPERVMQALGSGADGKNRQERGRAYLEKIVQLQIPIPVIFADEIARLLLADLAALKEELILPEGYEGTARFKTLIDLLTADVIHTPRDIRRLVGTFHVLAGMLYGEVDWIDLLAYSALLIKAPATVAALQRDPDEFLESPTTARAIARMLREEKETLEERLSALIPNSELNDCTKALLAFLIPSLSDDSSRDHEHADAFHERRPMLSTLRLGLLPGAYSRDEIKTLVSSTPEQIKDRLQLTYKNGAIDSLADRLDELYTELTPINHVSFWRGVGLFAAKPDCEWMSTYSPMHEKIHNFTRILEQAVQRNKGLREDAVAVFSNLRNAGEAELTSYWLRAHLFVHGLFGCDKRGGDAWFLSQKQTEAMAGEMAALWRTEHLSHRLIPCRWDLQAVYTMVDLGIWDDPCRRTLDDALADDKALDGFSLMLFGAHYSTDKKLLSKICTYERYVERAQSRLLASTLDETVRLSLRKAVGKDWPR